MTQEELRNWFLKYTKDPSLNENQELLSKFANFMLIAIQKHHADLVSSIIDAQAKIMLQMMFSKVLHLKNLIQGASFTASNGISIKNIVDPTVVANNIRNIFETAGVFNLIYRYSRSKDERKIIYNLWVISGLKYRQRFESAIISNETREKYESEGIEIQTLQNEIEETELYKRLNDRNKDKIQNRIRQKEFLISFEDDNVKFLAFHDLVNNMGIRQGVFDNIYTYFSLYAHPSNVSVFQFGDIFTNGQVAALNMVNFNIRYAVFLLSFLISDYMHLFPKLLETYNELPLIDQILINYPNRFLRSDEYSINDSWKALS